MQDRAEENSSHEGLLAYGFLNAVSRAGYDSIREDDVGANWSLLEIAQRGENHLNSECVL
jgi:hypothetical protein